MVRNHREGPRVKPYPEVHQQGNISIESGFGPGAFNGDLGVQIASDGRVWICIDGIAVIRFKPSAVVLQE